MFPEGQGARSAFVRDGAATEKTNELLENASFAIEKLWEQRGYAYDPKKPDVIKAKLGYELDRYEAMIEGQLPSSEPEKTTSLLGAQVISPESIDCGSP